uniref:Uncharacterized protein n=1 Tax=Brassica campestris TaxID=3711 RepID=M4F9W2_BRACM
MKRCKLRRGLKPRGITYPRWQRRDNEVPRGKKHAGSTTRSYEIGRSSTSSCGDDDAGDTHPPLPALPKDFVRGFTRVKQRGNAYPYVRSEGASTS